MIPTSNINVPIHLANLIDLAILSTVYCFNGKVFHSYIKGTKDIWVLFVLFFFHCCWSLLASYCEMSHFDAFQFVPALFALPAHQLMVINLLDLGPWAFCVLHLDHLSWSHHQSHTKFTKWIESFSYFSKAKKTISETNPDIFLNAGTTRGRCGANFKPWQRLFVLMCIQVIPAL